MIWTLLLSLLWKALPFIAAFIGFFGYGKYKERVGAQKEKAKQAAADKRANDVADEIQNDVRAMSPEQVDAELRARAKK